MSQAEFDDLQQVVHRGQSVHDYLGTQGIQLALGDSREFFVEDDFI